MDELGDDLIPYSTINLMVSNDDAELTVMCYDVRVHVEIAKTDLLNGLETSALCSQFTQLLDLMDDEPDGMQTFEDWLIRPCVQHLQHLPSLDRRSSKLSIHDYYHAPTLVFVLKNVDNQLEAIKTPVDIANTHRFIPSVSISDPTVTSALIQDIPCIGASRLLIVRDQSLPDWEYYGPPGVVEKMNSKGSRFYYKPALEIDSFTRELDIFLRIRKTCPDVHATKLAGLVQWDEDSTIAAVLLEYIPDAKTLDWVVDDDCAGENRLKWMTDLQRSVERLHNVDVVWGDVKPQNVLIDSKGQAWVADFGGGHSLPWVHKDIGGTKEGDLSGLDAIAKYLGV